MLPKPTTVQPDEDRDVFVHHTVVVNAGTHEKDHSWSVWLGQKKQTATDSQASALIYARQVADQNGHLSGWLVDGPSPPAAIDWAAVTPACGIC
ncbi:MAG TPA: hypothetical protein VNZ26_21710 [Vicinamibacterales bacterium]|jgi:hypothetical protein|nr:hypothetical protein [Vicinamibacterales bacterium]